MRLQVRKLVPLSVCLTLAISIAAQAQMGNEGMSKSPLQFGGACASQGFWTQDALRGTQEILSVINNLKEDKNCKGLKDNLLKIALNTEKGIADLDAGSGGTDTRRKIDRLINLPREISALRAFAGTDPSMRDKTMQLLMDRNVEMGTLSAKFLENGMGQVVDVMAFGDRMKRTATTGLDLIEAFADRAADMDSCMNGSEGSAGMAFAGAIKLAASFMSSSDGFTSRLSNTVARLLSVMRNRQYTSALRELNKSQFWTSMACLLETSTEAYCSALDAQELFRKGMSDFGKVEIAKTKDQAVKLGITSDGKNVVSRIGLEHPLQGFYLLVQQVPLITRWLQKIQIGVDPRLDTDAQFQSGILDTMNDHIKLVKILQGTYRQGMETLLTYSNIEAQRNKALSIIKDLTGFMVGKGMFDMGSTANQNFFTTTINEKQLPIYLLNGSRDLPQALSGNAEMGTSGMRWDVYMLNNGRYLPEFSDPVKLAESIGGRLQELIDSANIQATEYFSKWFIVDKPTLVSESVTEVRYTVPESLRHIYRYLDKLQDKIRTQNGDTAIIPNIVDTQQRIMEVLQAYARVRELGRMDVRGKPFAQVSKYLLDSAAAYQKVVDTVYLKFNVMLQKAGFMANRLATFVYADYSMMVRNGYNLTPYQQDIYMATGRGIVERMLSLYSGNPMYVLADLQNAAVINKSNLQAVENVFKDALAPYMASFDRISKNRSASDLAMLGDTLQRLYEDTYPALQKSPKGGVGLKWQFNRDNPVRAPFYTLTFPPYAAFVNWWMHKDRYPLWTSPYNGVRRGGDDIFRDVEQIKARLCVQSLAFEDWSFFNRWCVGTEMRSPFDDGSGQFAMSLRYNEASQLPTRERICAYRNIGRKHLIMQMTVFQNMVEQTTILPGETDVLPGENAALVEQAPSEPSSARPLKKRPTAGNAN